MGDGLEGPLDVERDEQARDLREKRGTVRAGRLALAHVAKSPDSPRGLSGRLRPSAAAASTRLEDPAVLEAHGASKLSRSGWSY